MTTRIAGNMCASTRKIQNESLEDLCENSNEILPDLLRADSIREWVFRLSIERSWKLIMICAYIVTARSSSKFKFVKAVSRRTFASHSI